MRTAYYPRCFAEISIVFDGRGAPNTEAFAIQTAPRSAQVQLNGFNEADTFELTYDARGYMFDPDLVASAAARVYLQAADSIVDARPWATDENLVLVGLADDIRLELSSNGRYVHITGRDYTSLLLDVDWPPTERIPAGKALDVVVQGMIDRLVPASGPFAKPLTVEYRGTVTPPIVGALDRSAKRNGQHVRAEKSGFDAIYDLCLKYGFLCFVDRESFVITEPSVETVEKLQNDAPLMVYGRNLASLMLERRLARDRVPVIEVTSYDPRTRQRITAKWPPNAATEPRNAAGVQKEQVQRVTAPPGVTDQATLLRFARTRSENLARREASYSWDTRHLRALSLNPSLPEGPSLLQLRAGDPVVVRFDPFNAEAARSLTPQQIEQHLIALGYDRAVARVVAANFDRLQQYQQPYYTNTVDYAWDSEQGLAISWMGANYAFVPRDEAR